MRVGTTRPALRQEWESRNKYWKALAYIERAAAWIFFLFHSVAIFRFVVELAAMALLIWGAVGVYKEFQQREIDRRVRIATLFAQIAETHALPQGKGLRALKPGVEALAREDVPMRDFDLTGAYLENADLQEADFTATLLKAALLKKANLRDAQLFRANLMYADLRAANLRNAKLFRTDLRHSSLNYSNLSGADFTGALLNYADLTHADLSGADLSSAIGLEPKQLSRACSARRDPPTLPPSFTWNQNRCPKHTVK